MVHSGWRWLSCRLRTCSYGPQTDLTPAGRHRNSGPPSDEKNLKSDLRGHRLCVAFVSADIIDQLDRG